jgi:Fe-S-cluster containining protein
MSSQQEERIVSANVTVRGNGLEMQARVHVPLGPTRAADLLPLARSLSDAIVSHTCRAIAEAGAAISCKKGCGACCDNLVAISEMEARRIRDVVESMPEPRRTEIRARFAAALARLERADLLEKLRDAEHWNEADYQRLVGAYFAAGVPCPFLEEGSCSIYEERPITCREYLVTSPAENCARLGSEGVDLVRLPLRVFNAVARWQAAPPEHMMERVVPLILALEWADAHPDSSPAVPGLDLLRELLGHLSGQGEEG